MGLFPPTPNEAKPERPIWGWVTLGIVLASGAVAVCWAVPFAGGWSDGSRLAAIESVGARGTLTINESIFVGYQVREGVPSPYDPANFGSLSWGTSDKMFVDGHFYSHHPPVPLLVAGAFYRVWLLFGGPPATERADLFVLWITITTAGLPFVVAVWCVGRLARDGLGLPGRTYALLTLSFAATTVAPAYSRQVNAHVILLGVGAVACLLVARAERIGVVSRGRLLGLGTVAGMGYCLDGALGPALVLCIFGYAYATTGRAGLLLAALAAAPWGITHHAVLYAIAGDPFSPASDPKNWTWPGSPFNADNLTGLQLMHSPQRGIEYLWDMLIGSRGFLSHNLPMFLAFAGAVLLFRRYPADRRAVAVAGGWMLIGATPYVLASNNFSGACLSIRWFVPFLAPGFWLIGMLLRRRPECVVDLVWLTVGGVILGYHMLPGGPWKPDAAPCLDLVGMIAIVGWGVIGVVRTGSPEFHSRDAASG